MGPWKRDPNLDTWGERKGFRCCSFCGSIHPDEWIAAVRESVRSGGRTMNIDRGKRGKWYARGKTEDGSSRWGKFYGDHMPEEKRNDPTLARELRLSIRVSWDHTFQEPSVVDRLAELAKNEEPDPPAA
jgi:hypothetical protein